MANVAPPSALARSPVEASTPSGPKLVPCLMIRKGRICLPGPNGPVRAQTRAGPPLDPFDVVDRLLPEYDRMYLVDLDGIERARPQLEYIQELSRDIDLWVDAGVSTAESAIDILVAGAQRAVLSSSHLRSPRELRRAWKLSTDWAFELEMVTGSVQNSGPDWPTQEAGPLAAVAREVGIADVILSPRDQDPDWNLVRALAPGGPTWVDGTFTADLLPRLSEVGAAGGIFHLDRLLSDLVLPVDVPLSSGSVSPRDDED